MIRIWILSSCLPQLGDTLMVIFLRFFLIFSLSAAWCCKSERSPNFSKLYAWTRRTAIFWINSSTVLVFLTAMHVNSVIHIFSSARLKNVQWLFKMSVFLNKQKIKMVENTLLQEGLLERSTLLKANILNSIFVSPLIEFKKKWAHALRNRSSKISSFWCRWKELLFHTFHVQHRL